MPKRVLIIDDDDALRFALKKAIARLGYEVEEANGGFSALEKLRQQTFGVALLDLGMPDMDGLSVLARAPKGQTRYIVLTGHGTVEAAVTAMKRGAFSFLEKPLDAEALQPLLTEAFREIRDDAPPLVGTSKAIEAVREFIARVGPTDETVAISGETGTGKEVVARNLHHVSARREKPFIACNLASVPRELFESELFGHKKGSFTGADRDRLGLFREAEGGTLFLDEVGELSPEGQAKLLRVLEERKVRGVGEPREVPVDVRVLSATHQDLWRDVQNGKFREDLYFRLNVFPLRLEPLRNRVEDIAPLALHLLQRIPNAPRQITEDGLQVLAGYPWPGNVRELLNALRRAALFSGGEPLRGPLLESMIAGSIFGAGNVRPNPPAAREPSKEEARTIATPTTLFDLEKQHILQVFESLERNVTKTAEALAIDRRTLQRKLKSYGVREGDDA